MQRLLIPGLLLLAACAPTAQTDPNYLAAYAQTPRTNLACIGNTNRPGPALEVGPNACTLVVYPTQARDASRAEYQIQIFYRTPVGTLLAPRYENRVQEIKGEAPLSPDKAASVSFPVYIPDRDFLRQAGRILGSAFSVVLSLAPTALGSYLGIPIPPIGLDRTSRALWDRVEGAIADLVNNKDEPYAVQITARVCGPQLCSPSQGSTVKAP